MICVKLIPQHATKCFEKSSMSIQEIISGLEDNGEGSLIVVVNGKIVDNVHVVVSEKDEVVIVQEFLGG